MRRREFITLFGGAATCWPLNARAQQPGPMRRIGSLMNRAADDLEGQGRAAFQEGLQQLAGARAARYAEELIALAPDIILAAGSVSVATLQRVTRTCRL